MNKKRKIVIIGATSTIAEHCARLWLQEEAAELTMVARNTEAAQVIAADLKVRSPNSNIEIIEADFVNPKSIETTVSTINQKGAIDIVLIAQGSLDDQQECQKNSTQCHSSLEINALSPVLFAEAFINHMELANHGILIIIGSVAGDRGRKSNYIYGAAKGLLSIYVQGLQHRLAKSNVKVILVKPGPTDTKMTASLKAEGMKMAAVETVAQEIVAGISGKKTIIYTPSKWRFIMLVIKKLPHFIFNKMDI